MKQRGVADSARAWSPAFLRRLGGRLLFREGKLPRMSERERDHLREIFRPNIRTLSAMTDVDLSHWVEEREPARTKPEV